MFEVRLCTVTFSPTTLAAVIISRGGQKHLQNEDFLPNLGALITFGAAFALLPGLFIAARTAG